MKYPSFHFTSKNKFQIIRPDRSWLSIEWAEIWQFRDLLSLLIRRDFLSKYKQTILGPLWIILQPLLTTLVFTVVFGKIAKISTAEAPAVLFYLCGLTGWNFLSQTFTIAATTFITNASIFQKVYFPRLLVPFSVLASSIFGLIIQLLLFFIFYLYFLGKGTPLPAVNYKWLLLPFLFFQLGLIGLGAALWSSTLTAKYRDLSHVVPLVNQLWMYATALIYPLSAVPSPYHFWVTLNPATAPLECIRSILLGTQSLPSSIIFLSLTTTLVIVLSGLIAFRRAELTATDMA